jgi:hypothetical protein
VKKFTDAFITHQFPVVVYVVTSAVAVMAFVFAFAVVAIPFIKHKAFKKGEINERRRLVFQHQK